MNNQTFHFLAISGSLRAASSNSAVLQAIAALAPPNITITLYSQLGDLPHFNPDLDKDPERLPAIVRTFREQIGNVDALLISTPEYAHGVPGVLKNALDWLVGSVEFPYKAVALINISPHSIHAPASLKETLKTMSANLVDDPAFTIAIPRNRLDVASILEDDSIRHALQNATSIFVEALKELPKNPSAE